MNVIDAAHRIGLDYPGGIEALAVRMGKNPAVLRSKLNPNCATHGLMLEEAVHMQSVTGQRDIVVAMAEELGGVYVQQDIDSGTSDVDLSRNILGTVAQFGKWMHGIEVAVDDDRVTPHEAKEMQGLLIEMIARASRLQSILSAMSRNG